LHAEQDDQSPYDNCAGSPESVFDRCSWFYALCRERLFADHTEDIAGAVTPLHAFAALGINFLDGTTLPGLGDAFTLHVQYAGYSQSAGMTVVATGNADGAGAMLVMRTMAHGAVDQYVFQDPTVAATTPWKRYSVRLAIPANSTSVVEIGAMLQGGGTLWVDDVELVELR